MIRRPGSAGSVRAKMSLGGGGGAGPRARDALLRGQTPRRVLRGGKRAGPRANASWAARRKGREPNLQYGLQSTAKKFYGFLFIRSLLNGVFDDFDCNLFSILFCTNVYIV